MELPSDPFMLLSMINMKLRDQYSSLSDLCDDMDINRTALENRLKEAGFEYVEKQNQFK